MITRFSDIIHEWMGWCPNAPALRTDPAVLVAQAETVYAKRPDGSGSAGRSGRVRLGVSIAAGSLKTLARNRQLLWFTLLAGLVLAGNIIGQSALRYIGWTMRPDIIVSYALDFLIEFATLFCLVFLLAGLVLSVSSKKEGSASFFVDLAGAKKYLKAIFLWSVVLALAGMLLFRIWFYFFVWLPLELRFLNIFGPFSFITSTLSQFPFNWTLDWNMFTELPGYGGRSLLLWIYPFGFMEALIFSAINLLLFVLTPFVVPLIVLEQKTIKEAVVGSFAMMKKTWAEVAACALFLGVVVSGVFLTYLIVQAASGMVSPYETVTFHPTDMWIALGFLYNLALLTFVFVVATVGGIATLDLYKIGKNDGISCKPGGNYQKPEPAS